MKNFQQLAQKRSKVRKESKPKYDFRKPPTPIPKDHDPYENISRIMPSYVAHNYEYFELITAPKQHIKNWEGYLLRIKEKITGLKRQFLL